MAFTYGAYGTQKAFAQHGMSGTLEEFSRERHISHVLECSSNVHAICCVPPMPSFLPWHVPPTFTRPLMFIRSWHALYALFLQMLCLHLLPENLAHQFAFSSAGTSSLPVRHFLLGFLRRGFLRDILRHFPRCRHFRHVRWRGATRFPCSSSSLRRPSGCDSVGSFYPEIRRLLWPQWWIGVVPPALYAVLLGCY